MRFLSLPLSKKSLKKKKRKNTQWWKGLWMKGPTEFWIKYVLDQKVEEELNSFPTLRDLWFESQKKKEVEGNLVEARLYHMDSSFYYLQSGLKKDILLNRSKYYVSAENPIWFCLNGLDLNVSCKRKLFGHYKMKRWFWSTWYYRKKIARLHEYYNASMLRKQEQERIWKESPQYVCRILSGGILVHWNSLEDRRTIRSDWEVHYSLYQARKELLEEGRSKEISVLFPRKWAVPRNLKSWVQSHFFSNRRKVKVKKRGLFKWAPSSNLLIFRRSGKLDRKELFLSKIFFLDLKGIKFVRK